MSNPSPIVTAFNAVEQLANQGRFSAVTAAFAAAARNYEPLIPFATAINFMAGLARGKGAFVRGVQSLCRSEALRGSIDAASPSEKKDLLQILTRGSGVTSPRMAEASQALLNGILTIGAGEWLELTLQVVLNSVIQAGGLGELLVRLEARLHPFPEPEEAAALTEMCRLERGFQWPVSNAELDHIKKRGLRGEGDLGLDRSAEHLVEKPNDFLFFNVLAKYLRTCGILPIGELRFRSRFLIDFLLNRATPRLQESLDNNEHEIGCCYPWSGILAALCVPHVGMGVYIYPDHVHVTHRQLRVACEAHPSGEKLWLEGEAPFRQAHYLVPGQSPYSLRALVTTTLHQISVARLGRAKITSSDEAVDDALKYNNVLCSVGHRICATDGMHRSLALHLLSDGNAKFDRAMWHLDQAEILRPNHPMTAFIRGIGLLPRGLNDARLVFAEARRRVDEQCRAIATLPGFRLPPFMRTETIDALQRATTIAINNLSEEKG